MVEAATFVTEISSKEACYAPNPMLALYPIAMDMAIRILTTQ